MSKMYELDAPVPMAQVGFGLPHPDNVAATGIWILANQWATRFPPIMLPSGDKVRFVSMAQWNIAVQSVASSTGEDIAEIEDAFNTNGYYLDTDRAGMTDPPTGLLLGLSPVLLLAGGYVAYRMWKG